jgi:ABC-type lipoprotein export system ATPase subunit
MSFIKITNIRKRFDKKLVIKKLSLTFESGQVYFIEGPSGCGKTTLLNLIAGIEKTDFGQIFLNHLSLGYLPQNFQLMNELSVIENIALPLWIKGASQTDAFARAHALLKKMEMSALKTHNIRTLSGGEKQRVAFARALITNPDVLLLDEPFNQLDHKNLKKVFSLFKNWFDKSKICIWVRHDKKNAPLFSRALSQIIKL